MSAQLPRRSLLWLMGMLAVVVAPHLPHLPLWVLAVLAIALGWRYRVYQGRWAFPSRLVRALLVLMAFIAVGIEFRTLNGLDPAVSLLVLAAGLKTMEMRVTRDYLVVCFVGYFLVAAQLLFEQEIPYALAAMACALMVTAALVARHQREPAPGFPHPLALATRLLAQALPLMLVLFVVFPRIAPLWALPQSKTAAKTGPGSTMSPGDVARLSGSSELAFRVTFDGPIPAQRDLYWRGLVLSEFDGRQWTPGSSAAWETELALQGARRIATRRLQHIASGRESRYEVILEPTNQPWTYVLGYPLEFDQSLRLGSDYRLMTGTPVSQRMAYRVRSDLDATLEPELGVMRRRAELQLPDGYNPRARAQALEWRAEAGNDLAYIERVLDWFNREDFVYTLQPPLLGRDTVDEFLFGERRGFCEHYANAFVFLLRAAGVPARVVVGYQGGERNPYQDYLLVHHFDAHAWAEAWMEGRGWVRFDPTAAVSPERIESSLSEALGDEFLADSVLAMERYRGVPLLAIIRMRWDLATYHWARLVLQYDTERQTALLTRMLGEISVMRLTLALLGCGGVVLLAVALSLFGLRPRTRRDPATVAYLRVCEELARSGLARRNGEGALAFLARVREQSPENASGLEGITQAYVDLCYRPVPPGEREPALLALLAAARRFRGARRVTT